MKPETMPNMPQLNDRRINNNKAAQGVAWPLASPLIGKQIQASPLNAESIEQILQNLWTEVQKNNPQVIDQDLLTKFTNLKKAD